MGTKTVEKHQEMGTKTVKRLAILIGVIALIGGGGYLLWWAQVSKMTQGVLARADEAVQKGEYVKAADLYREHLAVVPDDVEVQLKFADVLTKQDRQQVAALAIYEDALRQFPSREDVRRRAADMAAEVGRYEQARGHLAILLKTAPEDGHLEYLMGRCQEEDKAYDLAETSYGSAIKHGAPERIEAARRRATLLDKLGKEPGQANQVVDAMVESAPDDFRVYLERGRFRSRRLNASADGDDVRRALKMAPGLGLGWLGFYLGGGDDFLKAMELAPDRPEIYREVAAATERDSGYVAARQVLDKGLDKAPDAVELYLELASLERRTGHLDQAVAALESGLKKMPDQFPLHMRLALFLAEPGTADRDGQSGKLQIQINELERLGAAPQLTQYLNACYHYNRHELAQVKQILTSIQADVASIPELKSVVNVLLSRCYTELGEVEMAREAMLRAYGAQPENIQARLGWIGLIARGQIDEAIRQYQALVTVEPRVRLELADLLIRQNRGLPEPQRHWGEVERLIAEAAAAAPGAPEPELLRARMLVAQGQGATALDVLATAAARSPANVGLRIEQVEVRAQQKEFKAARELLDRAERDLGDKVDLRLARARLAMVEGGPQVIPTLNKLAGDIEPFSRDDRRRLLTDLATYLGAQQDLAGATRAWSQLAEDEPESLQPRLRLFDLAIQSGDAQQAEAQVRAIEKLDDQYAQFCRAQYLAWQARGTGDAATKASLRVEARGLLTELKAHRPDWSRVPLALAKLDEQELEEAGPDVARRREKLESVIASYRRAIELGYRDTAVVQHFVQLLFRAERGGEALEFYNQIPGIVRLPGDLERMAVQTAMANRDFRQAEELARKAVAAKPEDFERRVWLAVVLIEDRRLDEAKAVLREAVDADKADPDRWSTLVRFEVQTRHPDRAERIVQEAEAHIAKTPLALAQCCGIVGKAYQASEPDRARLWYDRARGWFARAQEALKDPHDPTVRRRLAEFLLQTNPAEAEAPLKEILARAADGKSPDLAAWARRSLAQVYTAANPPRTAEALALFDDPARKGGVADPDDLRILSMVHEAQGTPEGRRQAVGDLESLIGRESATPDDRRRLAMLLDAAGKWPQAREQFRQLVLRTEGARDTETLRLRPLYLALFVEALARHHQPGDDSDLAEARQMVAKLGPLQDGALGPVLLEAQIDRAAGQLDAATARIRDFAGRPGLTTADRSRLAAAAERIGLLDAAEAVYRRIAAEPPADTNKFPLVIFLARHGRLKDAVDLCETLWAEPALRENVAAACIGILSDPGIPADTAQLRRVIGWMERARAEAPRSLIYLLGMGNFNERLGDYRRAEEMYRTAIRVNDREGIASNNLAWLIVLQGQRGSEALDLINNAIRAKGAIPEYLDTRGMIYLNAGEKQLAVADLEKALRAAPSPPKYFHLAQAYLQLNENEKARRILEAGKTRGLPGGLHPLELAAYKQVSDKLGTP